MPELPEVEVTRMAIEPFVSHQMIHHIAIRQYQLRWPIPKDIHSALQGSIITSVQRRGKYLAFLCLGEHSKQDVLLIHLGMSGHLLNIHGHDTPVQKHDHVDFVFEHGILRYHDPRRFGAIILTGCNFSNWHQHHLLASLGVEPLQSSLNHFELFERIAHKKADIKSILLSGKWVVGVGNIYANEVLFRCGIHPLTPCQQLNQSQISGLIDQIQIVLRHAIDQGGSSIKDFVQTDGKKAYFQMSFQIYGRSGQDCIQCNTPISKIMQKTRASYFCPQCQVLL